MSYHIVEQEVSKETEQNQRELSLWKEKILKTVNSYLFWSYLINSLFNQGYVLYEDGLSFEEPSGLSHSPRQTGVLENYPAQKNTEQRAFPTFFPRTGQ
jgi:hypothetical protein